MRTLEGHKGPVRSLAFSPDGSLLASGGDDHTVFLWTPADARPVGRLTSHRDWVRCLAFSPDGKLLASAGWDDTVRLWSLPGQAEQKQVPGYSGGAWSIAFARDGAWAAGAGDGRVTLYRTTRSQKPVSIHAHRWPVSALAFSGDGKLLLTASHDQTIKLWGTYWGREQGKLAGHTDWVRSIAVAGGLAASGADDGRVILWALAERAKAGVLEGHAGPVSQVAFCPDGRGLLSVGWDGVARLWDARAGRLQFAYQWERGRLLSLAVAPDGMTAAAGGQDGVVVLWDLDEA